MPRKNFTKSSGFTSTPNFGVSLPGKRGFTLIELLVVISIIGFLASASMLMFNSARIKARDAKRRTDLKQISTVLQMYYDDHHHTYQVANSGSGGSGVGWFNYFYTTYDSVAKELKDLGYIGSIVQDPSGLNSGYNNLGSGYMIYASPQNFTLWTSLENPSAADTATQNRCTLSSYDSYTSSYPVNRRMNYCVSD
ncbi:MAG: type II secretion system protein [Candidatus Falkowbacteria bacterium]